MKFHVLTSTPHYREHALAVFDHLQEELKGYVSSRPKKYDKNDIVLIAGFADLGALPPQQRVVYIEHGAGQNYLLTKYPEYYHGSTHPENVIGYICPRRAVARSWGRPAFAAGSPVCDPHPLVTDHEQPILVWTHHWDAQRVAPEARSALPWYGDSLEQIVKRVEAQGFKFVGHHHPRDKMLPNVWKRLGVPVESASWVRENVDLLVCDNSSMMYECAYLCRHVLALNAPWYRREVEHGLRFWDWQGQQINDPEELLEFDFTSVLKDPQMRVAMHNNARAAYTKPFSDGSDGQRAATWLTARFA